MLKRIFALLLSAVLLLGLLAGCSKNQPDGTNEQSPSVQPPAADTEANAATSGTKYAYVPTYIALPVCAFHFSANSSYSLRFPAVTPSLY